MARRSRQDDPGSWHHVINRGLAKRPLFEDRVDVRYFLSRLAREVRRGRIEVHAWCVLTTHFHLLLRSPAGELSEALRRAQNEYSRFFNRRHRRDGTLIRGRFFSKPVTSLIYRHILVRYIDSNPVRAQLASAPWDYPWCSAAQYVHSKGPRWLERSWVEAAAAGPMHRTAFRAEDYVRRFGEPFGKATERFVETRLRTTGGVRDELDDLVGCAPTRVLAWMRRKAKLADGGTPGLPVCDAVTIREALHRAQGSDGDWLVAPNGHRRSAWELMETGLSRTMAGQTWEQIGRDAGVALSVAQRRYGLHQRLLEADPTYATKAAEIGAAALSACVRDRDEAESG